MFYRIIFWILCFFITTAQAGVLYKCPKANGKIEFRGSPCPHSKQTETLNPATRRPWRGMMLGLSRDEITQIYALKECYAHAPEVGTAEYDPEQEKVKFKSAVKQFLTEKWPTLTEFKLNQVLMHYQKQSPIFKREQEAKINQLEQKCLAHLKDEKIAQKKESPDLLVAAASNGFLKKVKKILKRGVDVDYTSEKDYYQNTALIGAAKRNQFQVVKFLLSKGANANKQNLLFSTPLLEAAKAGASKNVIYELVYYGAKVNYINPRDKFKRTSLYWAIDSGNAETVYALLNKGAKPNACFISPKTKQKQSPLEFLYTIKNKDFRIQAEKYLRAFRAKKTCI